MEFPAGDDEGIGEPLICIGGELLSGVVYNECEGLIADTISVQGFASGIYVASRKNILGGEVRGGSFKLLEDVFKAVL